MINLLLIFLGGAIGSLFRYEFSVYFPMFFLGTFLVNFIGCVLIAYFCKKCPNDFFTTGFCGGFTTLGTFWHELYIYMQNGMYLMFVLYLSATIIIGLIGIKLGTVLGEFE